MRFISLLFVLFLASCAVNPATGGASFNFMSEEAEFDLGHDIVAKELERQKSQHRLKRGNHLCSRKIGLAKDAAQRELSQVGHKKKQAPEFSMEPLGGKV